MRRRAPAQYNGPLTYSREQAEALVRAAEDVIKLLRSVEDIAFGDGGYA